MEKGATAAAGHNEMTDGLHETAQMKGEPMGEKTTGTGTVCLPSVLS